MNNKGWVGILLLIIFLCIVLIGLAGFVFIKLGNPFKNLGNKVSDISQKEIISQAQKGVTTLPSQNTFPELKAPTKALEIIKTTPTPTLANPKIITYSQPKETCTKYEIKSGDLKSNKCYGESDYQAISRLYSDYSYELDSEDYHKNRLDIVCDGSEFFKDSCEDAKKDYEDHKDELAELKSEIRKIISRGK